MNLAETLGFVFRKENTGEMGIPYSSPLPIFSRWAVTGCWGASCCGVMIRLCRFRFEGADCPSRVRCFCTLGTGTRFVLGPFSWGQVHRVSVPFSSSTSEPEVPDLTFQEELCTIKNKRLPFKIVSFLYTPMLLLFRPQNASNWCCENSGVCFLVKVKWVHVPCSNRALVP